MKDDYIDLFEDYYFERLSPDDLSNFKNRLHSDPELKKAFRKFQLTVKIAKLNDPKRELLEVSQNSDTENINTVFENDEKENIVKVIPFYRSKGFRNILTAAAVIAAVIIGSRYLLPASIDRDEMYASLDISSESQQLSKAILDNRITAYADTSQQLYYEGLDHFNNKNYSEVILSLEKYTTNNASLSIDTAFYFLGESHRILQAYEEAIGDLNKISNESNLYNYQQMSLLLCYLKLGKEEEALSVANNILENPDTTFHKEAKRLVEALK